MREVRVRQGVQRPIHQDQHQHQHPGQRQAAHLGRSGKGSRHREGEIPSRAAAGRAGRSPCPGGWPGIRRSGRSLPAAPPHKITQQALSRQRREARRDSHARGQGPRQQSDTPRVAPTTRLAGHRARGRRQRHHQCHCRREQQHVRPDHHARPNSRPEPIDPARPGQACTSIIPSTTSSGPCQSRWATSA